MDRPQREPDDLPARLLGVGICGLVVAIAGSVVGGEHGHALSVGGASAALTAGALFALRAAWRRWGR